VKRRETHGVPAALLLARIAGAGRERFDAGGGVGFVRMDLSVMSVFSMSSMSSM